MNTKLFQSSLEEGDPAIDADSGTIKGVSMISLGEAKGHDMFVDATTLQQVFNKSVEMGTVKVKADHGSGVFATIGYMDNFSLTADKVLGDMHIYEAEPEKPRIFEIADKNPDHLGVSIEFSGDDERIDGTLFARCTELITAALVSDPAANKSLFSKKTIDDQQTHLTVDSKLMANTTKKTKTTALETGDQHGTDKDTLLAKMQKKMDEMEARLSKYEESSEEPEGSKGVDPKAVDPQTEPETDNTEELDPETGLDVDVDESAAMDDSPEDDEDSEDDKKKAALKKKGLSRKSNLTRKDFISMAAKFGMKVLPAGGSPTRIDAGKKDFESLVKEHTKDFFKEANMDGKKAEMKSRLFCIQNYKAEYAEWTKPFISRGSTKTL